MEGIESLELVSLGPDFKKQVRKPDALADIIFIHGLGGNWFTTWANDKKDDATFWPCWLATALPEAQVWSLEYPAPFTNWTKKDNVGMSVEERARSILDLLVAYEIGKRPLMFISHSLGGLMVKQVLRTAHEFQVPKWKAIAAQTKAIVFIATPHDGSGLVNLGKVAKKFISSPVEWVLDCFARWSDSVEAMEKDCPHLLDLKEWYKQNAEKIGIDTKAYYEKKELANVLVVTASSGNPDVKDCIPVPIDGDHLSICKPVSTRSAIYLGAKLFLQDKIATLDVGLNYPVFQEAQIVKSLNDWPVDIRMGKLKEIIHPVEDDCSNGTFRPVREDQQKKAAISKWDLDRVILYVWERYNGKIPKDPLIHVRHEFQRVASQKVIPAQRIPSLVPLYYAVESCEQLTTNRRLPPELKHDLQYMHDFIKERSPAMDENRRVQNKFGILIDRCI